MPLVQCLNGNSNPTIPDEYADLQRQVFKFALGCANRKGPALCRGSHVQDQNIAVDLSSWHALLMQSILGIELQVVTCKFFTLIDVLRGNNLCLK